ncbi:hypothetical protein TNIN_65091 [Trichonephila inaurata madagascariensis]|uniref:Uncharacterized protein n=1 Tax=Trichonephila inaurata madagascariensis TaxID=2747483 RepID=A0A8X6YD34_9ARAC|nr:hypothetical protein TNIN_65091 [Trichonephila inaurata madagascariensis]
MFPPASSSEFGGVSHHPFGLAYDHPIDGHFPVSVPHLHGHYLFEEFSWLDANWEVQQQFLSYDHNQSYYTSKLLSFKIIMRIPL